MLENGNKIGSYRILRLLENMLVGSYGRAVLSDFGVSKRLPRDLREELKEGLCREIEIALCRKDG